MKPYGLPNRIVSELSAKILESPKLLNYIYYTDIENQYDDLFALTPPKSSEIIDKFLFIGRRPSVFIKEIGAYVSIRVNRYEPLSSNKSAKLIKYVEINIDVICHVDCQKTTRGTRDITIITLLQEALENECLTGIADNVEIVSTTQVLGLPVEYDGYQLKIKVTGFNQGLYNETD